MKKVLSLVIANALMASVAIFPSALPVQAENPLGEINIDKYCKNRFGQAAQAKLVENTAWGWRCSIRQDLVTLSMDNACRFQYPNKKAYSRAKNSRDPYSWICLTPALR